MQLAAWVPLTKAMLNTASPSNQDVFSNRQWRQRRTLTKASWNSTHKNALRFWKSSRCKTIVVIVTLKSMAHPTKMHAAILTIIMHKTTFKKKSTIDNIVIWVMVVMYFQGALNWKYPKVCRKISDHPSVWWS